MRWSASLLALLFLIIVATVDLRSLPKHAHERLFWTLTVREIAFAGGAMVLAGSQWPRGRSTGKTLMLSGRLFVGCTFVFYAIEHFLFPRFVPGVPLEKMTPGYRVVARIPESLSFVDAASLPIGAITAWEAMFREQNDLPVGVERVLIVGAAGGVGSIATQLLKAKTNALVISTASRPESREWCYEMGADLVIDHSRDIQEQLAAEYIEQVDMVLSTANVAENLPWITKLLRPFGHLSVIDMPSSLGANALMLKSTSLHTEMIFSKILHGYDVESQGRTLEAIAAFVAEGRIRPIATTRLSGLTPETMRTAHQLIESRRTIGKVAIAT